MLINYASRQNIRVRFDQVVFFCSYRADQVPLRVRGEGMNGRKVREGYDVFKYASLYSFIERLPFELHFLKSSLFLLSSLAGQTAQVSKLRCTFSSTCLRLDDSTDSINGVNLESYMGLPSLTARALFYRIIHCFLAWQQSCGDILTIKSRTRVYEEVLFFRDKQQKW